MKYKHKGGVEPITACAVGACSAAAPALTPLLAALGIGTGVVAYKNKKSKKKNHPNKLKKVVESFF